MNPLTLDALRKTIRKVVSGNRAQPERKSMRVYIVQRDTLVGNEVDCFTDPVLAQEWAHIVGSHVQIEETMDERLPEFIETYKRLPVIADEDDPHGRNCAQRIISAAECTCGKADRLDE